MPDRLAIVGIGCRFPGGIRDAKSCWEFLRSGKDGVTEIPENRWNAAQHYSPDIRAHWRLVTKRGGFLDNLDEFDADFFGITPREALRLDPQQRWLLEVSWEALEDSATAPSTVRGDKIGVYVGIAGADYRKLQIDHTTSIDVHTNTGNTFSIAANRISYFLDLKGPSLAVDTACSSAMVAIHLGCQSIWSGESDSVLVGGVNSLFIPDTTIGFSKASMLSPNGKCHAFDSRANGYVRSEGVAMLYLKRESDAIRDGNPIYALI
ncbi:MAG: polyketide synthase, partial [Verrucomicrobiota bacterium]